METVINPTSAGPERWNWKPRHFTGTGWTPDGLVASGDGARIPSVRSLPQAGVGSIMPLLACALHPVSPRSTMSQRLLSRRATKGLSSRSNVSPPIQGNDR